MKIKTCQTLVEPRYVLVGSKSDDTLVHSIVPSTIFNDPLCDCKGYLFRGICSHIAEVESTKCMWFTNDLDYEGLCPNCGAGVVEFELEPEYA
jgi:hypothetical protein